MCLTKSGESGKDCKGAVAEKDRRGGTCDCVVTHASSFVFCSFRNCEQMELLQERCTVLMAGCSENKACSSILYFLHRLNNRAGSVHEEIIGIA